jgi:hypothetical protein
MNPMTLYALTAAGKGIAETASRTGQSIGAIDRLSDEEKARLKELERQQALGLLGLDAAQQQQILNRNLMPIQSLQGELQRQQAQSQLIGNIGQGAAFRQRQLQQEQLQKAQIDATDRAQQQIQELDRIEEAKQQAELDRLKRQKQINQAAIAQLVTTGINLGVGGTTVAAAQAGKLSGIEKLLLEQQDITKEISTEPIDDELATEMARALEAQQTLDLENAVGGEVMRQQSLLTPEQGGNLVIRPTQQSINELTGGLTPIERAQAEEAFIESVLGPNTINQPIVSNQPVLFKQPGQQYGYIISSTDELGRPTSFQFVKSDGSILTTKYELGTPQFKEALNLMALQQLGGM